MKNANKKEIPASPFHGRLILVGFFLSFLMLLLDVPWPVYHIGGMNVTLGIILFFVFIMLTFLGMVLGIIAGIAARKGYADAAKAGALANQSGVATVTPSPGGSTNTTQP
ncbi:hypothetical protein [Burkholderia cenocepacia]|uniref:hypothetical protein n=1 Tax=Burkholderia cenocepacia TaxID=95486 RepID=UPI0007617AF3|nr:hypothetical protein [Burkholderia cenocepacia]KWU24737.1 hypothetical protein AS149_31830 [Burkholderia cenocepacia]